MQREQLHRQVLEVFFTLASHYAASVEFDLARQYAYRQIELEPWGEEAHRQVMPVLASRATDVAGNTQPMDVPFNQKGYLMNAIETVPVWVE
jgi:hypothetical protein